MNIKLGIGTVELIKLIHDDDIMISVRFLVVASNNPCCSDGSVGKVMSCEIDGGVLTSRREVRILYLTVKSKRTHSAFHPVDIEGTFEG